MNSTDGKGPLPAGVATSTGTSVPSAALIVVLLNSAAPAHAGTTRADAKMAPAMASLFMVCSCRFYGPHSRPAYRCACAVKKYPRGHEYLGGCAQPSGHQYPDGYMHPAVLQFR